MAEFVNEEELMLQKRKEYAQDIAKEFKASMQRLGLPIEHDGGIWRSQSLVARNAAGSVGSEDLAKWLKNPRSYEKQLRAYSKMLFNTSGEYQGLINHFVNMARFYPVFDFSGDKDNHAANNLKKELRILSEEFSHMRISHEIAKVFASVMIEDVFYGYEVSDKHSYFILKLDPDYCRLAGQSDGMWTFQFDFSYFTGTRSTLLDSYPKEFRERYRLYANRKDELLRWQSLEFSKSVCFKLNETKREIIPPLASTFEGISDLNEYRRFKKVNTKLNNYMLLHQKVPMFKDTEKTFQQNNFMIDPDTMMMFHNMLDNSLPEEIGAVVSPMEIEAIKLEQPNDRADKVAEATRDVYNAAGVNQYLFNPDKNSTGGLSKSIKKDEMITINFYLQVARWLNRKLTMNHPKWKHWSVRLLPTTGQSEHEYAQFLTQLGTLGFPVVGAIASMLGYDLNKVESMVYLENEVLNLKEQMIPFASSHTGGVENEGGRPEKSDTAISDSGQANRDSNDGVSGGEK